MRSRTNRFFDCLSRREFPTPITIRDGGSLDYLLVRFGTCAHLAADMVRGMSDRAEQRRRLSRMQNALQRPCWFTVEFGLMRGRTRDEITVYGSGLLSSYGEIVHSVSSDSV